MNDWQADWQVAIWLIVTDEAYTTIHNYTQIYTVRLQSYTVLHHSQISVATISTSRHASCGHSHKHHKSQEVVLFLLVSIITVLVALFAYLSRGRNRRGCRAGGGSCGRSGEEERGTGSQKGSRGGGDGYAEEEGCPHGSPCCSGSGSGSGMEWQRQRAGSGGWYVNVCYGAGGSSTTTAWSGD